MEGQRQSVASVLRFRIGNKLASGIFLAASSNIFSFGSNLFGCRDQKSLEVSVKKKGLIFFFF